MRWSSGKNRIETIPMRSKLGIWKIWSAHLFRLYSLIQSVRIYSWIRALVKIPNHAYGNGIENRLIYTNYLVRMPINANTSKLGLTTAEESKKEVINLKEVALYGSFLFYQRVLHEGIENEVEPRMTCRFSLNRFTDHSFWSTHINLLICVWQVDLGSVSFSIPLCQIPDTHTHS